MTFFQKYFKLFLISAVFAGLLMLFKFGVVEPAYTLKPGNPPTYGEMFGPVDCLKNWVYGGLILAWMITLFIASLKNRLPQRRISFRAKKHDIGFFIPRQRRLTKSVRC